MGFEIEVQGIKYVDSLVRRTDGTQGSVLRPHTVLQPQAPAHQPWAKTGLHPSSVKWDETGIELTGLQRKYRELIHR